MRALFILCEQRHHSAALTELKRHAHIRAFPKMANVLSIDIHDSHIIGQSYLVALLKDTPRISADCALVIASREISEKLRLPILSKACGFELKVVTASALTRPSKPRESSLIQSTTNQCGLSILSMSTSIIQRWTHAQIDRADIDGWLEQFGRLGSYTWIGKSLLSLFYLKSPSELSEHFSEIKIDEDEALCVNREPRGNFKSAEVVGNLLGKRFPNKMPYGSPAEAMEKHGEQRIVLVEDGLWSGTEAIGILDSLLGNRDVNRLKTEPLQNPEILNKIGFRLVYGIGTDYGQAIVRRSLNDRGLPHISVECAETVHVAKEELIREISNPGSDISAILETGPKANQLRPFALEALRSMSVDTKDFDVAVQFCKDAGFQLFSNYIEHMKIHKNWKNWPSDKLDNAACGMHGLGLAHAFGHSIPKASLPLFWGSGPVKINGRSTIWKPLLPHS